MPNAAPLRVLFRVAAGPRTGFGHLVRASTLARALGIRPVLSVRGPRQAAEAARRLGGIAIGGASAARVLASLVPDVLVVDDRVATATRPWRRAARRLGIRIVSIHDLGIGAGDADLVVDGSLGAEARWRPAKGRLLGPMFAILNPQCVGARRRAKRRPGASHVVIALGGGPRRMAAERLAALVLRRRPDAVISVAGGFVATGHRRGAGPVRWLEPRSLGAALATASVAVVGGGVTLYEAAALGVPVVAVAVVPSQRATVEAFAAAGAAIDGGSLEPGARRARSVDGVAGGVTRLLGETAAQRRLARAAARLVDTRGAERVAAAIRGLADGPAREAAR